MTADLYEAVKHHPAYLRLVRQRARWAWGLASLILLMYFSFILLIAFRPEWLATPLGPDTVITVGIPVGVAIILLAFVLTGIYVHKANTDFDVLTQQIRDEIES